MKMAILRTCDPVLAEESGWRYISASLAHIVLQTKKDSVGQQSKNI